MCVTPIYDYYLDHGGKLSDDEFAAVFREAFYTISKLTFTRSENPPELMRKRVQDCICEIVDVLHSYNKMNTIVPRGVSNVSNDGYSVSKGTSNTTTIEDCKLRECEAVCRKYLLMPINLMYTGVC